MRKLGSLFNEIIKAKEPILLMSHEDAPAITVFIDSQTHNIPVIYGNLNYLEKSQHLMADQYMSKRLLESFLINVNFEDFHNRKEFKKFARELLSCRYRGDRYEILGYKKLFILHNISGNYNYRQVFNK